MFSWMEECMPLIIITLQIPYNYQKGPESLRNTLAIQSLNCKLEYGAGLLRKCLLSIQSILIIIQGRDSDGQYWALQAYMGQITLLWLGSSMKTISIPKVKGHFTVHRRCILRFWNLKSGVLKFLVLKAPLSNVKLAYTSSVGMQNETLYL